jgi:hypothetical protein
MPIRPGMLIDIIDQNRHMKSMIYDVINRRIIIAQPSPPLTKHSLNREISITFLVKKDGHPVRHEVRARVTDFITNYHLASSEVTAVGLEQKTGLGRYDLRMDYRVRPPADSNLGIARKGQRCNIIDISVGGFQFSHRGEDAPKMEEEFEIALMIDERTIKLSAKVSRITMPVSHDPDLLHVGAKFMGDSRNYERHLRRKILEIQRKLLAEGKLV